MQHVKKLAEIKDTFSPVLHKGTVDRELIGPSVGAKNFILIHGELEPGGEAQPHSHFMEQAVYILSGKFAFEIDDQRYEVGPESAVFIPSQSPHRITNIGQTVGQALVVLSPVPEMREGKVVGNEWKAK